MIKERDLLNDASAAYDHWHSQLPVDEDADAPWHALLKSRLEPLKGKRVLEIGCGRGGFAAWLASSDQRPAEVVACDFSARAVKVASEFGAKRGLQNVFYRREDITSMTFGGGIFDIVISCETIEHVSHPRRAIKELARVLRPGGMMYLTCPNYLNVTGLYRLYLPLTGRRYRECGQPINNFLVLPRVHRWLRIAQMQILSTEGSGHYFPFPRRSPIRVYSMDNIRIMNPWHALHTLTVAQKPLRAIGDHVRNPVP
jgi:2-polyprenyl-3-methyl-5-hydroxy-6-metoxy-1,4-benzoquinol methylase